MMLDVFNILVDSTTFCVQSGKIWKFIGNIVNILQIAIPVIIILLGTIDLGKAVMAGDDKKIKEAQKMLLMRLIYGVAIFFVVIIVKVVFGLVADSGAQTTGKCFECVSKPSSC